VILRVLVPGDVVPTARVRIQHGAAQTPRSTVEYQAKIARATRAAVAAQGWLVKHPGPVEVSIVASGMVRGDVDNVLKGALDGLVKGHAIADDSVRVVRTVSITTLLGGMAGLSIEVHPC
jgi:Holliday junction resolvase RusA-like endonuclease